MTKLTALGVSPPHQRGDVFLLIGEDARLRIPPVGVLRAEAGYGQVCERGEGSFANDDFLKLHV